MNFFKVLCKCSQTKGKFSLRNKCAYCRLKRRMRRFAKLMKKILSFKPDKDPVITSDNGFVKVSYDRSSVSFRDVAPGDTVKDLIGKVDYGSVQLDPNPAATIRSLITSTFAENISIFKMARQYATPAFAALLASDVLSVVSAVCAIGHSPNWAYTTLHVSTLVVMLVKISFEIYAFCKIKQKLDGFQAVLQNENVVNAIVRRVTSLIEENRLVERTPTADYELSDMFSRVDISDPTTYHNITPATSNVAYVPPASPRYDDHRINQIVLPEYDPEREYEPSELCVADFPALFGLMSTISSTVSYGMIVSRAVVADKREISSAFKGDLVSTMLRRAPTNDDFKRLAVFVSEQEELSAGGTVYCSQYGTLPTNGVEPVTNLTYTRLNLPNLGTDTAIALERVAVERAPDYEYDIPDEMSPILEAYASSWSHKRYATWTDLYYLGFLSDSEYVHYRIKFNDHTEYVTYQYPDKQRDSCQVVDLRPMIRTARDSVEYNVGDADGFQMTYRTTQNTNVTLLPASTFTLESSEVTYTGVQLDEYFSTLYNTMHAMAVAYPNSDAVLQIVSDSYHNAKNDEDSTLFHVQSNQSVISTSVSVAISAISLVLALVATWADTPDKCNSIGQKIIHTSHTLNATRNVANVTRTAIQDIAHTFFGLNVTDEHYFLNQIKTKVSELEKFLKEDSAVYVTDPIKFSLYVKKHDECKSLMHSVTTVSKEDATSAIQTSLRSILGLSTSKISEINIKRKSLQVRQETVCDLIVGVPGVGKSHFCDTVAAAEISKAVGCSDKVYGMNFVDFAPKLCGERIATYHEFGSQRHKDPIFNIVNLLGSNTQFALQAAEVDKKEMFVDFVALMCTSNTAYVDISAGYTTEFHKAVMSRLNPVELLNREINGGNTTINRDDIDHSYDPSVTEIRVYDRPYSKAFNGKDPRKNKPTLSDQQIADFRVVRHSTTLNRDVIALSLDAGSRTYELVTDGLAVADTDGTVTYKVYTVDEYLETLVERVMKKKRVYENQMRVELAKRASAIISRYPFNREAAVAQRQMIVDACVADMIPESIYNWLLRQWDTGTVQAHVQPFVIGIMGQGGSGKTTAGRRLGRILSVLTGYEFVEIPNRDALVSTVFSKPVVVLVNDLVYFEADYVSFFDALPSCSVLINTCNVLPRVTKQDVSAGTSTTDSIMNTIQSRSTKDSSYATKAWNWFVRKLMGAASAECYEITMPTTTGHIPGTIRRMGLVGNLRHAGQIVSTSVGEGMAFYMLPGFQMYSMSDYDYLPVEFEELTEMAVTAVTSRLAGSQDVAIRVVTNAVLSSVCPQTPDLYLKVESFRELVSVTNNFSSLVTAVLSSNLPSFVAYRSSTFDIKVSNRLQNSVVTLNPASFMVPNTATLDNASEIGVRMYSALRSAGPEFTVHIYVQEGNVNIVGRDRLLYVDTAAAAQPNLEVTETPENLTFRLARIGSPDEELVLSKDQFREWIRSGVSRDLSAYSRRFVTQLLERLDLISHDPAYALAREVASVNQTVELSNASMFSNLYEMFKAFSKSKVFLIMTILGGLAASVTFVLGCVKLCRYMFGSKSRKNIYYAFVNGDKTPVAEVEEKKPGHFSYKTTNDGYWVDKDVPTALRAYLESMGVEAIVDLSPKSPQSEMSVKKPPPKPVLTTLKELMPKKPQVLNRSQMDQFKAITKKFETASCTVATTIGSVAGLCIKDKYILFPSHVLVKPSRMEIVYKNQSYFAEPLVVDRHHDLGLAVVTDKSFPSFTDITKHFKTCSDTMSDIGCVLDYDCGTARYYSGTVECTMNYATERYDTSDGELTLLGRDARRLRMDIIMEGVCITSADGWCGKPYFDAGTPGERVCVGFHHSGGLRNQIFGVAITKELVHAYLEAGRVRLNASCAALRSVGDDEDVIRQARIVPIKAIDMSKTVVVNERTREWIETHVITDDVSPNRFSDAIEGESLHYVGYTASGPRSWRMSPDHKPTPWASELANSKFANMKSPVITDPMKLPDVSQLVKSNDGSRSSIMFTQAVHSNDAIPTSAAEVLPYIKRASVILSSLYKDRFYKDLRWRPLVDSEVINGLVVNPRDAYYKGLDPMNMDSAPGFALRTFFNVQKTGDLFEQTSVKTMEGAYLYDFSTDPARAEAVNYMKTTIGWLIDQWSGGRRATEIVEGSLKMETRPREKVAVGGVRMFEQYSKPVYFVFRKYLGRIMAAVRLNRSVGYAQVGGSVEEATAMYNRLSKIGTNAEAGDYKAWDKHVRDVFIEEYAEILYGLTGVPDDGNTNCSLKLLFQNMIRDVYNILVLADGHLYITTRGHASGCPITTLLNCGTNELLNICVLLKLQDEHNALFLNLGNLKCQEKYQKDAADAGYEGKLVVSGMNKVLHVNAEWMISNFDMVVQGDDIVKVVSPEYEFLVNHPNFKRLIMWFMGTEYTPPTKDSRANYLVPLDDVWFLSRHWRYDKTLQVVFPVLKDMSAFHLLYWTKNLSRTQYYANIRDIMDEALIHSKERYNDVCYVIRNIIAPWWKKTYNEDIRIIYPVYEEFLIQFTNRCRALAPARRSNRTAYSDFSLSLYYGELYSVDPETGAIFVNITQSNPKLQMGPAVSLRRPRRVLNERSKANSITLSFPSVLDTVRDTHTEIMIPVQDIKRLIAMFFAFWMKNYQSKLKDKYTDLWNADFPPLPTGGMPAYHDEDGTISVSLQIRQQNFASIRSPRFLLTLKTYLASVGDHEPINCSPTVICVGGNTLFRLQITFKATLLRTLLFEPSTKKPQMDAAAGAANVAQNTMADALPGNQAPGLPMQPVRHIPDLLVSMQMYNKDIAYIAYNVPLTVTFTNITPAVIGTELFRYNFRTMIHDRVKSFVLLNDGGIIILDVDITISGSAMMTGAATVGLLFHDTENTLNNLQILPSTKEVSAGTNTDKYSFTIEPQARIGTTLPAGFRFDELFTEDVWNKWMPEVASVCSANIQQGFGADLAMTVRVDVKLSQRTTLIVDNLSAAATAFLGQGTGGVQLSNYIAKDAILFTDGSTYINTVSTLKPSEVKPVYARLGALASNTGKDFILGSPCWSTGSSSLLMSNPVFTNVDEDGTRTVISSPTLKTATLETNFNRVSARIRTSSKASEFTINGILASAQEVSEFSMPTCVEFDIDGVASTGLAYSVTAPVASANVKEPTKVKVYTHGDPLYSLVEISSDGNIGAGYVEVEAKCDQFVSMSYNKGIATMDVVVDNTDIINSIITVSDLTEVSDSLDVTTLPTNCAALRAVDSNMVVPSVASGVNGTATFPGNVDLYSALKPIFTSGDAVVRKTASLFENKFGKRVGIIYFDSGNKVICLLRSKSYELCNYTAKDLSLSSITDYNTDTTFQPDSSSGWVNRQVSTLSARRVFTQRYRGTRFEPSINMLNIVPSTSRILVDELSQRVPQGAVVSGLAFNGSAAGQYILGQQGLGVQRRGQDTAYDIAQLQAQASMEVARIQGQNSTRNILTSGQVAGNSTGSAHQQKQKNNRDVTHVPTTMEMLFPKSTTPRFPGQLPSGQMTYNQLHPPMLPTHMTDTSTDIETNEEVPSLTVTSHRPTAEISQEDSPGLFIPDHVKAMLDKQNTKSGFVSDANASAAQAAFDPVVFPKEKSVFTQEVPKPTMKMNTNTSIPYMNRPTNPRASKPASHSVVVSADVHNENTE